MIVVPATPMKHVIFYLCILCFPLFAAAKKTVSIVSGTVTDSKTQKPIELANVVLLTTDSAFVAGTASNLDGSFEFSKVNPGAYLIKVSALTYATKITEVTVALADSMLLTIGLLSEEKSLQEVAVTANRKVYTKEAGKATFNVAQSPTHQVGTADNVLQNMPGVTVDQDGNITIQGKQGVIVLVDGKTNPMANANLSAFLKSIPANAIESIELITNPSAKYQAEGRAGIINIKLKKGRADGLNASVTANYGTIARTNNNLVLNYRKNKANVFGTYAFNYVENGTKYIEDREIYLQDTSYYYMNSPSDDKRQNHTVKGGIDLFINPKNTLTYTGNFAYTKNKSLTNSHSFTNDREHHLTNDFHSNVNNKEHFYSVTNDLAYDKTFDTTERSLKISATHTYLTGNETKLLATTATDQYGAYDSTESISRNTYIKKYIHNVIAQLDYVHPFKKHGQKIEAGFRNETTVNKNMFDVYSLLYGQPYLDTLLSNNFEYTENISAIYGTWSALFLEKISVSGGVRAEHTFIQSSNNAVKRNYISFFPSVELGYSINDDHNLSLAYSRRINRPSFQQINNAVIYFDNYTTWQGNPYLRPSFFHEISVNYSATVKKHIFNIEVGGNFSKDEYTESSLLDTVNKLSRGSVINGSEGKQVFLELYTKIVLTKWWDFQTNHNLSYQHYQYLAGYNRSAVSGVSYNLWGSNVFRFWKNMTIDINGWMNVGGVSFQGRSKLVGVLNTSVRKSFLKNNNLTIAISAQNILQTMKWRWNTSNTNMETIGSWQSFNRTVNLSITYVFGNKNALRRQDDKSNSRLSGGGGKQ